jgi:hypothetical protein
MESIVSVQLKHNLEQTLWMETYVLTIHFVIFYTEDAPLAVYDATSCSQSSILISENNTIY